MIGEKSILLPSPIIDSKEDASIKILTNRSVMRETDRKI